MNTIRFCIENPVKVTVFVLLLILLGLIAVLTIPVQLTPNVDQPVITVTTSWTGRSPEEVEREVIEKQEDKLKGVVNLRTMTATASQGSAKIELEFFIGTDMTRVLQEVSDKLREVPEYPADVDQPVVVASESSVENPIAWIVLVSSDPGFDVQGLYDVVDKGVKPVLERVPGVSQVNIFGGRKREVHVEVNPRRLAERGITFNQIKSALQLENVNTSAGDLKEGRLDVRVRTVGRYEDLSAVRETIITSSPGGPVRVKDVAEVVLTLEKQRSFVRSRGQRALAINAVRETGANVMSTMADLRSRIKEVNKDVLPRLGPGLKLTQVYDETVYIQDAISLVYENLWQGGSLTVLVLLVFLRSWTPTLIISLSIPVSVIGTFVVMALFGRNLNVVSLAGLAFAVGMVVDNAIVVLENTDRHLGMGKSPLTAAYDGAREVGLAIFASTATTLVVFLPVVTLQEEAGQLFYDIALAIMASVGLSLVVALTVIPSATAHWLRPHKVPDSGIRKRLYGLFGVALLMERLNNLLARFIYWGCRPTWRGVVTRIGIVGVFTVVSLAASWLLAPPMTYLPKGNRNLVFGGMLLPPAYSLEQCGFIGDRVEAVVRPYWEAKSEADIAGLPAVIHPFTGQRIGGISPIENYFFVALTSGNFTGVFMGAMSADKENVRPAGALLTAAMNTIPGAMGYAEQASIFGRGVGGTNSVDVEISGDDLGSVRAAAEGLYARLIAKYGSFKIQPDPANFSLAGPEVQVKIDRVRAADLGIDVASLGLGVQSLVDGAVIGDYRLGGDTVDILLTRPADFPLSPDRLGEIPVAYHDMDGRTGTVPLWAVASLAPTLAPQQIKRIEQQRAVTLRVVPPDDVPLAEATDEIAGLVDEARQSGVVKEAVGVRLAGTADKLSQVREALLGRWHGWGMESFKSLLMSRMFLAVLVNYLVMAALFESWLYPFVIMFSVPLAMVGGFMGLRLVHVFDPLQLLDVVTMLGFVILLGTVVNNAILIVAQSLNFMKGFGESQEDVIERMEPRKAIMESVRTRMRPVMMTTITTLFGMLPLVVKPGSGSELYRGLGAVVLGGLLASTLFTLIVVPLVFSLTLDGKLWIYQILGWKAPEVTGGKA